MTEAPLHELFYGSPISRHFPFEPIDPRPRVSEAPLGDIRRCSQGYGRKLISASARPARLRQLKTYYWLHALNAAVCQALIYISAQ